MFEAFHIDSNGQINADELGRALAHFKYVRPLVSPELLLMTVQSPCRPNRP
jgi:type IV secretory pathway protease TraF